MRSKRKILFYTHALTGGGAERVWALLASGFARQGDEVVFACDFDAGENRAFLDDAVRLEILGREHLTQTLRLARLLRRFKPDASFSAIGVSNLKHGAAAILSGRLGRAIQSYHGYFESEPQLLSRLGYLMTPISTRMFARSICVSDGLHHYVLNRFHADPKRTVAVYNPVRAGEDAAATTADTLAAKPPVVLSAGRLVSYKNFPFLVRAFAHVEPREARLVIIGEGPEREAIVREIERTGQSGRIALAGYQSDPWPWYAQARAFALASESEAFGLVVVEALAYGLPVVSTDCHGPRQILADGRFGELVGKGDERGMAAAITRALAHVGDVPARQKRAVEFSVSVAVARYANVIEDVCGPRASAELATGARRIAG
jgi:glycosyltransferase involved in cell wall biosynthesis